MDLTRLAVDAGQFINRAVQYTEESLGQAEKTGLNSGLEERLALVEATKTWTDQIISQTEVLLQPNAGARLEDRLYEQLDWSVPPRPHAHEVLGDHMIQAGLEMGSNTPYGTALLRFGETQKRLGETERNLVQSTNIHFLTPLRSFTEGEYRAMQDERKMLVNKRLDLDIAKTRLRKAREADREGRNLNANPMEDDYMAHVSYMFSFLRVKWLKMWAQEISQTNHMRSLTDFVEAQACYFDQCNQHAQELQKQLASIPIVLCSNNWQLAIGDEVTQLSPNNHVADEPVGLNQVTAVPIEVHNNPDFSQDSWTANPPASTEKSTASTVTTQQNNNHNNNNLFSDDPATSHCSVINQALHHVSTANSDSHCTNQIAALSRTSSAQNNAANAETTNGAGKGTTTVPPPSQITGNESHNGNASASDTATTDDMTTEPQTANGMSAEPQTANEIASKQPTINGEDVQESSASQDMGQ
ncbi:Endophilin-B1 [Dissostichus eleginoides]|uniref:Endophilin-B1 n=1 Tax=Dissostichus eleginoides TaxID=100907 RepID=A0AAD9FDJ6_DISEL|nr:Endophilin-B1 [Dissostichus eleginoides]